MVVSYSHKNCDIQTRERLAFSKDVMHEIRLELLHNQNIQEALLLSTCNRTELIMYAQDTTDAQSFTYKLFNKYCELDVSELEGRSEVFKDSSAIKHILGVASALESVVVGEAQITGQLKEAYKDAKQANLCGDNLSILIEHAFKCAACVRNATDIGKNPVSISSSAVFKAKEIFSSLKDLDVLVYGTGEMATLAIKNLLHFGAKITLIGRDYEKSVQIAKEISTLIRVEKPSDLITELNRVSLFFSATSAQTTVIDDSMVQNADFNRYWFDIAMPRDIAKISHNNIFVYNLDDLKTIVDKNIELRNKEASKAFTIVGRLTEEFLQKLRMQNANPIIKQIQQRAKKFAQIETARAIDKGFLPKDYEQNLQKAIENAFKKFLHSPYVQIKKNINKSQHAQLAQTLQTIFEDTDEI